MTGVLLLWVVSNIPRSTDGHADRQVKPADSTTHLHRFLDSEDGLEARPDMHGVLIQRTVLCHHQHIGQGEGNHGGFLELTEHRR